ncbi:MAG: UDP-glucose 4-epimerase GalE, partial [Natronospirillum sp.]
MTILVTGGAGYIGSHTCIALQEAGYNILVLDNLCNANPEALVRAEAITGQPIPLIKGDIRDRALLNRLFDEHNVDAVIHFAGLKAVGESTTMPLTYYQNNVAGTLTLLEAMTEAGCQHIVFSSSATVYGDPDSVPIPETAPLRATNPYGQTKLMIEEILRDVAKADDSWRVALLRYFNPVGAHSSGTLGEDPNGVPNNLMPYITQVAIGKLPQLSIFGNDYDTPDGTGVRDYIHVEDLAAGHVKALAHLRDQAPCEAYNLGTGQGYSVLDLVENFTLFSEHKAGL